ncbi:FtsX-like permease family protein [Gallicola sp. Sow4_E12]|uniref:FtsX-like permease family protein n=1 Tax=Gallicola sp. Sow4_E12 TaxID=3438785 RepID=UPI003F928383
MKKLYFQLALQGIRKNREFYYPFLLSAIGMAAIFYIVSTLQSSEEISQFYGMEQIQIVLGMGVYIMGIFAAIFLFYTNNFLMKRRKKEFALYSILGMEKKHLRKVILWENMILAVITIAAGLFFGALLYKIAEGALFFIIDKRADTGYLPSIENLGKTALLFAAIYFGIFLNGIRQISFSTPKKLMEEARAGEKQPKANWLVGVLGILFLGAGYYMAVTVKNPLSAMSAFFMAVLLVLAGTYFTFMAVSIIVLKLLKKNKDYYYKKNHFTAVSGLIYRMKQNAAGLASICIFATAALILISSGVSLYAGGEDILRTRYSRDIMITSEYSPEIPEQLKSMKENVLEGDDIRTKDNVSFSNLSVLGSIEGNRLISGEEEILRQNVMDDSTIGILIVPQEDANKYLDRPLELKESEAIQFGSKDPISSFEIGDLQYSVKNDSRRIELQEMNDFPAMGSVFLVVPKIEDLYKIKDQINIGVNKIEYNEFFNLDSPAGEKMEETLKIRTSLREEIEKGNIKLDTLETEREDFKVLYGGIFFTGIFLALIFLMATSLSIYYKQLTEGLEDQKRFQILEKVGMNDEEIKETIKTQIRVVFLFPIIMAGIHTAFAFPILTKLLALANMTNKQLFLYCVIGAFAAFTLFYFLVYKATSRTYYNIVKKAY